MSSLPSAGGGPKQPSPIRVQYDALKRAHPGCILFFQLGDFYETFEADARLVAQVCGITLTSKEFARGDRVPLAGVPVARADRHIGRLVSAGHQVAICDQVSEPGHGLVEREVTRIITAGTVAEPGLVAPTENNLLAALCRGGNSVGLAHVDVTTGELLATEIEGPNAEVMLEAELQRLPIAECLVADGEPRPAGLGAHVTPLGGDRFRLEWGREALCRQFGVAALDGFGIAPTSPCVGALSAILGYVEEKNRPLLGSLRQPATYRLGSQMALDATTRRNLELTRTAWAGRAKGSLFDAVNRTRTPMGARRLRRSLGQPLLDRAVLEERLDAVEALTERPDRRAALRQVLGGLGDVERLLARVRQGAATPREVHALGRALRAIAELGGEDEAEEVGAETRAACLAAAELIRATLAEPGQSRTIRQGHSADLDALFEAISGSRRWIAELQASERQRTGIRSLKVGYNKVFGYYIEVTRPNLGLVPSGYTRRQTLVNAERFITPALKEQEARILTAEARLDELEAELFRALQRRIGEEGQALVEAVEVAAELDFLQGLAELAVERSWVRPGLVDEPGVAIVGGRHPVLEAAFPQGELVPNDCRLGGDDGRIVLVTGPNMAGKSTFLRQVALIVLLAQVGSFVPASSARIGLVDRIFTRIGAHDDLAAGASTFLVEMAETANILRHATPRSLVVLDEVGRGTSTHDGLCIARAVLEHLHDVVGAQTLFATHYHELTGLAGELGGLRNVTTAVDETDENLTFLYRVVPGAADRSYGVQVARLAGLPASVTARAGGLLAELERLHWDAREARPSGESGEGRYAYTPPAQNAQNAQNPVDGDRQPFAIAVVPPSSGLADPQPLERYGSDLVQATEPEEPEELLRLPIESTPDATDHLLAELLAIDVSTTTPLQSLSLLHELQQMARRAARTERSGSRPPQRWLDGSGASASVER